MNRILLVEDRASLAQVLADALESDGFVVDSAPTVDEAMRRLSSSARYVAVVTDLRLPGGDGIDVLRQAKSIDPDCPVIVMTGYGTVENAVAAMKLGAHDFIQKPVDVDHLSLILRRCREQRALRHENLILREEFQRRLGFPAIIGDSGSMRTVSEQIQKVAATDSTVVLLGESGTGKELFARALHQLSPRSIRPFVAVNCAAIPDTLIENELFGHEKGAYTGATSRGLGRFELADGGTIFLDEIGELGVSVQSKILRVLEERSFERIGGTSKIEVDVRIICATNRDLDRAVSDGTFRKDLFFRVNVFPVTIPPLRSRRGDIPALARHFVEKYAKELAKGKVVISEKALDLLQRYDWPGNVRELENCMERALILSEGGTVRPEDLTVAAKEAASDDGFRDAIDLSGTLDETLSRAIKEIERMKLKDALERSPDRDAAARSLGLSARALASKLEEHGITQGE